MVYGYAGQILKIDLSSSLRTLIPTSYYADEWIGGRGTAVKIYHDEISANTKAFDPQNCLIFTTGPLAGFHGLAGSRLTICGKSPGTTPEGFSYASLGGGWGTGLKKAGFDGIIIRGKSDTPVYLLLKDGNVELKSAAHFWGGSSLETSRWLKKEHGSFVNILAIGPAGENLVKYASVVADDGSTGSGGFGAVMGSKKLKAIVVSGNGAFTAAQPDALRLAREHVRRITQDRTITPPNFAVPSKKTACSGCISGCLRTSVDTGYGDSIKSMCQASGFYAGSAIGFYKKPTDTPAVAYQLCNSWGLDTMVVEPITIWLSRCLQTGLLTEESTGLPISRYGSLEFIQSLLRNIALRSGFGDVLARGIYKAAEAVGKESEDFIEDLIFPPTEEIYVYDPRMYVTTALFYATEPKRPITQLHEVAMPMLHWHAWNEGLANSYLSTQVLMKMSREFWGGEVAADFSTYEGKALAAKIIQDRQYAYECLTLCNYSWPIAHVRYDDHAGDSSVEGQILSSVIGKPFNKEMLYHLGERVFNLQRAILVREGWIDQRNDDIPDFNFTLPLQAAPYKPESRFNKELVLPGEGGKVISKQAAILDRDKYASLKKEYYHLRGWEAETGLQRS